MLTEFVSGKFMEFDINKLKLVSNDEKFFEFIRKLRNDPDLISGFISQDKITREQQIEYMKVYKSDYNICLYEDKPVGFIGVVDKDVRLAVKKEFQRKGVASFMLSEASKINPNFTVQVKADNIASLGFFEKNGFKKRGTKFIDSEELVIMEKAK